MPSHDSTGLWPAWGQACPQHYLSSLEWGTHVIGILCCHVAAWGGQEMWENSCVHIAMWWYWTTAHAGQVFPCCIV